MRLFHCVCGNTLYFGSTQCLKCGCKVGFDPGTGAMTTLSTDGGPRLCGNGLVHGVCNWVVRPELGEDLCLACGLNQTIPNLHAQPNRMLWGRVEAAKRRLLYSLLRLGIPIYSKRQSLREGLAFEIVSKALNSTVTTGHLNGLITVNLEEADDTYRQINRQIFGENRRTLLRHFRHESAHYLWMRFVSNRAWGDPLKRAFREVFGDDSADYGSALRRHYFHGPPSGWEHRFVSGYAASHPWEDWAETWAHYLQMMDGLESCEDMRMDATQFAIPLELLPLEAGALPSYLADQPGVQEAFLAMLQRWIALSNALNEVTEALGEPPPCPFVISPAIAQKLRLAHHCARAWAGEWSGCTR